MVEERPAKIFLEFARDIILMALNGCDIPDELHRKLESLNIPKRIRAVEEAMSTISLIFLNYFEELFYNNQDKIFGSGKKCTTFILCRCLNMCEKPSYLSLTIVGSFLYALIFFWLKRKKCYHILKLCEFSLLATYRRFAKILQPEDNFETLWKYFELDADESLKNNEQMVEKLIEKCKDADESTFIFTEFEFLFFKKEFQKENDAEEMLGRIHLEENYRINIESNNTSMSEESNASDSEIETSDINVCDSDDCDTPETGTSFNMAENLKKSLFHTKTVENKHSYNPKEKNTETPEQGTVKFFDKLEKEKSFTYFKQRKRETSGYSERRPKKIGDLSNVNITSESDIDDPETELSEKNSSESDIDNPKMCKPPYSNNSDKEIEETPENIEEIFVSEGIDINDLISDSENADCEFCSTRCKLFLNRLNNFN